MQYGYFDDEHLEYVITQPDTPLPWINYLGMEDYFGIISNTAGGYSFYKDARLRRLTRYRYNNAPLDVGGRYIYIRDDDTNPPDYWSPTWQPTRSPLDFYECRHGLNYSTIRSQKSSIECSTTYFVPLGSNLEIWKTVVTNQRTTRAQLSLFSAVEFCLWDALDDANNFQRNYSIGEVEVVDDIIYHKSEYRERRNHFAFFTCSESVIGFDTQREDFLGPYRGWDAPLVMEKGNATNSISPGWQPIGVQQIHLTLEPGESRTIIFLLGYHENPADDKFDPPDSQVINKKSVKPVIERFLQPDEVEKAFTSLKSYWKTLLDKLVVATPDSHTNRMVNIWNAYQMMTTFNFSRSASYFESGIGRGMGFRDSNQDLLGFMHLDTDRARNRIIDLAATQLPDGGAYHQYQPMTKHGNNDIGSNFNDDPLWLVLSTAAYIKETGNWKILDEQVTFDNKPGSEKPLYEHLQRSIAYTTSRLGPHGLPLIGRADWNDCLNLNCFSDTPGQSFQTTTGRDGKIAESVFIAGLFIVAAREMEEIANRRGLSEDFENHKKNRLKMESAIQSSGWDGNWFLRAYDDFGNPVGSHACQEGKIFIEPQGMCVMAGVGLEDGKAQQALDSVASLLANENGVALVQPAFTKYYLNLGEITSYPTGYKENGSVFCHSNPWVMIAETRLGHGDRAFDYYLRINPSAREHKSEIHRCEPYVYAQMIAGPEAVKPGEAKNSWLTGTASWNYVAITQWILGIRPTFDGLLVDPVIPAAWDGFRVRRTYRACAIEIVVHNPMHVSSGVTKIILNGEPVTGNLIPAKGLVTHNLAEVWLGE